MWHSWRMNLWYACQSFQICLMISASADDRDGTPFQKKLVATENNAKRGGGFKRTLRCKCIWLTISQGRQSAFVGLPESRHDKRTIGGGEVVDRKSVDQYELCIESRLNIDGEATNPPGGNIPAAQMQAARLRRLSVNNDVDTLNKDAITIINNPLTWTWVTAGTK